MIEANDIPINAPDPYDESMDYTQRMIIGQNEGLLSAVRELSANIHNLVNFSERQREKEAPTAIPMGSDCGKIGAGTVVGATHATTQRFRVTSVLLSAPVAANLITIKFGSITYTFWTSVAPAFFPLPIEIDRGIDINVNNVTTPAGPFTCILFGYSE